MLRTNRFLLTWFLRKTGDINLSKSRKRNSSSPLNLGKTNSKQKTSKEKKKTEKQPKEHGYKTKYIKKIVLPFQGIIDRKLFLRASDFIALGILYYSIKDRWNLLDNHAFWLDEIWRVDLILAPDLFEAYFLKPSPFTAITSPLFVFPIRLFTSVLGVEPNTFRLFLLICAALLGFSSYMFFRRTNKALALCTLYFFSHNPVLTYWTWEFKPYIFDALVLVTIYLYWSVMIGKYQVEPRKVKIFFIILSIALLASFTTVMLLPGIFATFLLLARQGRILVSESRLILFSLLIAIQTFLSYLLFWRYGSHPGMKSFWSNGFSDPTHFDYLNFLIRSLYEPFINFTYLEPEYIFIPAIGFAVFCVFPLFGSYKTQLRIFLNQVIFMFFFFATLTLSNVIGIWPLGDLRVNLFYKVILFLFLCVVPLSFDFDGRHKLIATARTIFLVSIILYSSSQNSLHKIEFPEPVNPDYVMSKFRDSGDLAESIKNTCVRSKSVVVLNPPMGFQFKYYVNYDKTFSKSLTTLQGDCVIQIPMSQIGELSDKSKLTIRDTLQSGGKVFWLFSNSSKEDVSKMYSQAKLLGAPQIADRYEDTGDGYFQITSF